jgi:hypothetical protein
LSLFQICAETHLWIAGGWSFPACWWAGCAERVKESTQDGFNRCVEQAKKHGYTTGPLQYEAGNSRVKNYVFRCMQGKG